MRKQLIFAVWVCSIVLFSIVPSYRLAGQEIENNQTISDTPPHSAINTWYGSVGSYAVDPTGVEYRGVTEPGSQGHFFVAAGILGLLHYSVSYGGIALSTTHSTGGCTRDVALLRTVAYAVDSSSGTIHTWRNDHDDYSCSIPGGSPICVAAGNDGYCYVGTLATTGYNFYSVYVGTPENPATTPYIVGGCRVSGSPRSISINPANRQAIIALIDANYFSVVDIWTPSSPAEIATYGYEAPVREAQVLTTPNGNVLGIACGTKLYACDLGYYASVLWSIDFGWEVRAVCGCGNTGQWCSLFVVTQAEILDVYIWGAIASRGPIPANVQDITPFFEAGDTGFERAFVVGGSGQYHFSGQYNLDISSSDPISIAAPARGATYSAPPTFSASADLSIASGGMYVTVGTSTDKYWFGQVESTSEFRLDTDHGDWAGWCTYWTSVVPDGVLDLTLTCQQSAWPYYPKSVAMVIGKDTVPPDFTISTPIASPMQRYGPSTGAPVVIISTSDTSIVDSSVRCYVESTAESFSMYRTASNEYILDTSSPQWDQWSEMWLDPLGFDSGAYIIRVEANDRAGNLGFREVMVYWDISSPQISVIQPDFTLGTLVYGMSSPIPTFRIAVVDYSPIVPDSVKMIISSDSSSEEFILGADSTPDHPHDYVLANGFGQYGQWAAYWQEMWPGFYSISFSASDMVGNVASDDDILPQDRYIIVDLSGPVITAIDEPGEGAWYSNQPPTYSITIGDVGSNVAYLYYTFDADPVWGQGSWHPIDIGVPASSISIQGILDAGWGDCNQGPVRVSFLAFDSGLNSGQKSVIIYKDTIEPVFQIQSPEPSSFAFEGPLSYSLAITEPNVQSIWASNDGWVTSSQLLTSSGTLPGNLWPSDLPFKYGSVHIDFKVVDKAGNVAFDGVDLFMMDSAPVISINEPLDSEQICYGPNAPQYDLEITNWNVLENLWVSIDGGVAKYTLTSEQGQLPQAMWNHCSLGVNTLVFHGESLYGRSGEISVEIQVDNRGPDITIVQPQNGNKIGATPPMYVLRVTDAHIDYIYITFDGGQTRIDVPSDQLSGTVPAYAWDAAYAKTVNFEVVAVDTFGNINSVSITVIRSDWIRPDSGTHESRGDDIGFGLFFYMPMEAMIYLGIVFSVTLAVLIVNHRRNERAVSEGYRA